MLKPFLFSFLLTFIGTPCLFTQAFEGIILLKGSGVDSLLSKHYVKGKFMLHQNQDSVAQIWIISNGETGDRWTMMEKGDEKIAVKQNIEKNLTFKREATIFDREIALQNVMLESTKDKKEINGVKCIKIKGKSDFSEGEAWVSLELKVPAKDIFPASKFHNRKSHTLQVAFARQGFIMQMWIRDLESGKIKYLKTKLVEQKLEDHLFIPPKGFEMLDMTNMRELMQAAKDQPKKVKLVREMMHKSSYRN